MTSCIRAIAVVLFALGSARIARAQTPELVLPAGDNDIHISVMHAQGRELIIGAGSGSAGIPRGGLWRVASSVAPVEMFGIPLAIFPEWKGERGTWVAAKGLGDIQLQNLDRPERDREFQHVDGVVEAVSSDGRWAAIRRGVAVLGERERLVIRDLHAESDRELPVQIESADLVFGPQPQTLAIVRQGWSGQRDRRDAVIELWNVLQGQRSKRLATQISPGLGIYPGPIAALAFSTDGERLAVAYHDDTVRIWHISSGTQERTFTREQSIASMRFSRDNRQLALGFYDGAAEITNALDGTVVTRFAGAGAPVESMQFLEDVGLFLVGHAGGIVDVHESRADRPLGRFFIQSLEGDWLASTPDGLFDGSEPAWNTIHWKFQGSQPDTLPVEAFFKEYFSPGLLGRLIAGELPPAPPRPVGTTRRETAHLTLGVSAAALTEVAERSVTIEVTVAGSIAATDVRLFRNGTLVHRWPGATPVGSVLRADALITTGTNTFSAYAFNDENVRTAEATLTITGARALDRRGELYMLAVGIDAYPNREYELTYAGADARAVAERFQAGRAEIIPFAQQLVRELEISAGAGERVSESTRARAALLAASGGAAHITVLIDREATRERILAELQRLSQSAKPEDAVVVFFSGHGMNASGAYYLLPYDFGYEGPRAQGRATLATFHSKLISDDDLNAALEPLQAGVAALIIDACESGGLLQSRGLAQLAYEKGMYLLAAAQSYQGALESSKLGHGLLTYAIAELGLGKDSPLFENVGEGVGLAELLEFAAGRLPFIEEDKQPSATATVAFAGPQQPQFMGRRIPESIPLVVALQPLDPLRPQPLHRETSSADPEPRHPFVFSPAGVGTIADAALLSNRRFVTANSQGFVDIWQVTDLLRISRVPLKNPAALAVSPRGDLVAVLTADVGVRPSIALIDPARATIVRSFAEIARQSASANGNVAWSSDARYLLVAVNDAALVLEAATGALVKRLEHQSVSRALFASDDSTILTVSVFDGEVRRWEQWNSASVLKPSSFTTVAKLESVVLDAGRGRLLAISADGVRMFDVNSGKQVGQRISTGFECQAAAALGESFFVSGWSGQVVEVSGRDGRVIRRFGGEKASYFRGLVASGDLLLGFGLDDGLAVWNVGTGQLLHDGTLTRTYASLQFSGSVELLLAGVATGQVITTRMGQTFTSAAAPATRNWYIRPHGGSFLITGNDRELRLWNASTLTSITVAGKPDVAAANSDGSAVVYCVEDKPRNASQLFVWRRASSAMPVGPRLQHECPGLDIDRTGRFLATTSGEVEIIDARSGKPAATFRSSGADLETIHFHAFSADGTLGAFATHRSITVYRLSDRKPMVTFQAPGTLTSIDFTSDGRIALLGTLEGQVVSVVLETRRATQLGSTGTAIEAVAIDSSGRIGGAIAEDGATYVFALDTGQAIATARPGRGDGEWLVEAPDGRFDASEAMLTRLAARAPDGSVAPLSRDVLEQRTPGLLGEVMRSVLAR